MVSKLRPRGIVGFNQAKLHVKMGKTTHRRVNTCNIHEILEFSMAGEDVRSNQNVRRGS